MKKILIILGILILVFTLFISYFGDFDVQFKEPEVKLEDSNFYKNYYSKQDILLVNVWSLGTMTLLHENPSLEDFIKENNLTYICFSNSKKTKKIKELSQRDIILRKYDLTIDNLGAMKDILKSIEFSEASDSQINFNIEMTPYYAIIKDKKIYYKSNDFNPSEVKKILKTIKN